MTMPDSPRFNDADVQRYLAARAEAVARRAAPADDMAVRVAAELGLVRRRLTGGARLVRLAVVVALLAAIVAGAILVAGLLRDNRDYAPSQPQVTTTVHGSPWGITAAAGSIWVGGYLEPVIFELEPATGAITRELPIGKRICGELAAGYDYLWFTTCPSNAFLGRVDPRTQKVDRLAGYGGDRIGFGNGLVWSSQPGTVEGIDPVTLQTVTAIPSARRGIVVYAFDDVWISDADGHVVARLDPEAGGIVTEVAWSVPGGEPTPVHMVAADGGLWVVDEGELSVYRIDPATNTAVRADVELQFIDGTGWGDHVIAFGGGGLWVRESESTIARIDTTTLSVAERITTRAFGGGAFIALDDSFWYSSLKGNEIVGLQRP